MKLTEERLQELAYELYKLDWKREHITQTRELEEYRLYYLTMLENAEDEDDWDSDYTFEDWLWDQGYGGELYVCYNEFLDAEYEDKEYIKYLLCENSMFWKAYKEYEGVE